MPVPLEGSRVYNRKPHAILDPLVCRRNESQDSPKGETDFFRIDFTRDGTSYQGSSLG